MGYQIIKQPDGQYAVYSSCSESFVCINATKARVIEQFLKEATDKARESVEEIFAKLEEGEDAYYQFTKTFAEAARNHLRKDRGRDDFNRQVKRLLLQAEDNDRDG